MKRPTKMRTPDHTQLNLDQDKYYRPFIDGYIKILQTELKQVKHIGHHYSYMTYTCGESHDRRNPNWKPFRFLWDYCERTGYDFYVATLIRDWNLARGISQEALVREADANRLLSELAAWMHQEKPAGIATEGEVLQLLSEIDGPLRGKPQEHPDVKHAVSDFLERIRQYTGLFVERAPRRYGFMHLTFEEYFAARWLVARPRKAAARIREKLHRPRWEEPILLAIAFYGMEFPDDVTDLVEEAILGKKLGGSSPFEEILHRDLLFAVRAMSDQDFHPGLQKHLLKRFVGLWLSRDEKGKYQAMQKRIHQIATNLEGSTAYYSLIRYLIGALSDDSDNVRSTAGYALGQATQAEGVVGALLGVLSDDSDNVRSAAGYALGQATQAEEVVDALLGALSDDSENVRRAATRALRQATQAEGVVGALFGVLSDDNESVRYTAAESIAKLTKRHMKISLKDLSEQLTEYIYINIPELEKFESQLFRINSLSDYLFESLQAVAPYPKVKLE